MKETIRESGKRRSNELAKSDNMFIQMGRSSYTHLEFALMMNDIAKNLEFNSKDRMLDAGGGTGWTSIYFSPLVSEITLFDYAEDTVEKAKKNTEYFGNIEVCCDDILEMKNIKKKFNKIVIGSTLQYMENEEQVIKVFKNIYNVLENSGRAMFTHNPDLEKKQKHIQSYSRLDWEEERLKNALQVEEERYWFDRDVLISIAKEVGFSSCYISEINPNLFQASHMFDFVVHK